MKCDNCHSKKYPLLFALEFCEKTRHLCPACCADLLYTLKNFPAYIVPPKTPAPRKADPQSLAGQIMKRAAEIRAAQAVRQ